MFTLNNKAINIYAPHTGPDGTRYPNLLAPEWRTALGVVEIPDPTPPADYSEATYYRTEQQDAPYIVWTRKSQEQIDAALYAEGMAKIRAMELEELMPRTLREFLLEQPGAAQKGWYAKVAALDNVISTLKATLPPKPTLPEQAL